MSRCGYSEDVYGWALIRWRGQVASSIRGPRGQALLRDLLTALDAMPDKRLIADELVKDGDVCALGCVGIARGINMAELDPEDYDALAETFNVPHQLIQEIEYINDESGWTMEGRSAEKRYEQVRKWVAAQIKPQEARQRTEDGK